MWIVTFSGDYEHILASNEGEVISFPDWLQANRYVNTVMDVSSKNLDIRIVEITEKQLNRAISPFRPLYKIWHKGRLFWGLVIQYEYFDFLRSKAKTMPAVEICGL